MNILSTESNRDCLSPLHVLVSTIVSYIACNIALYALNAPKYSYALICIMYFGVYFLLMKINGNSFKG